MRLSLLLEQNRPLTGHGLVRGAWVGVYPLMYPPLGLVRGNVYALARWKARGRLPIRNK